MLKSRRDTIVYSAKHVKPRLPFASDKKISWLALNFKMFTKKRGFWHQCERAKHTVPISKNKNLKEKKMDQGRSIFRWNQPIVSMWKPETNWIRKDLIHWQSKKYKRLLFPTNFLNQKASFNLHINMTCNINVVRFKLKKLWTLWWTQRAQAKMVWHLKTQSSCFITSWDHFFDRCYNDGWKNLFLKISMITFGYYNSVINTSNRAFTYEQELKSVRWLLKRCTESGLVGHGKVSAHVTKYCAKVFECVTNHTIFLLHLASCQFSESRVMKFLKRGDKNFLIRLLAALTAFCF